MKYQALILICFFFFFSSTQFVTIFASIPVYNLNQFISAILDSNDTLLDIYSDIDFTTLPQPRSPLPINRNVTIRRGANVIYDPTLQFSGEIFPSFFSFAADTSLTFLGLGVKDVFSDVVGFIEVSVKKGAVMVLFEDCYVTRSYCLSAASQFAWELMEPRPQFATRSNEALQNVSLVGETCVDDSDMKSVCYANALVDHDFAVMLDNDTIIWLINSTIFCDTEVPASCAYVSLDQMNKCVHDAAQTSDNNTLLTAGNSPTVLNTPSPKPTEPIAPATPDNLLKIAVPSVLLGLVAIFVGVLAVMRSRGYFKSPKPPPVDFESDAGANKSENVAVNALQLLDEQYARAGREAGTLSASEMATLAAGDILQGGTLLKQRMTVDGVTLGTLIGAGSFGRVYKGVWQNKLVAVKVVPHSASAAVGVRNEAELAMKLTHPNVIRSYHYHVFDKPVLMDLLLAEAPTARSTSSIASMETWLIQELCELGSLAASIYDTNEHSAHAALKSDMGLILSLCRDIARGLEYLHSINVCHGDLKCENVLLGWSSTDSSSRWPCPSSTGLSSAPGSALFPGSDLQQTTSTGPSTVANVMMAIGPEKAADKSAQEQGSGQTWGREPGALAEMASSDWMTSTSGVRTAEGGSSSQASCVPLLGGRQILAKVADFGLSRALGDVESHLSTVTVGTVTHMPPELLMTGQLRPSADVYAFGIIMWQMATRRVPYEGMRYAEIVLRVATSNMRPQFPPNTLLQYQQLAERCWQADPEKRPTIVQVVAELEAMLANWSRGIVTGPEAVHLELAAPTQAVAQPPQGNMVSPFARFTPAFFSELPQS